MNLLRTFHWSKLTVTLAALVLSILVKSEPGIIISASFLFLLSFQKRLNIHIPRGMAVTFMVFCICSLVLGSYYDFYEKFSWWDDMLHGFYGAAFALIGFLFIQYLSYKRGIENEVLIVCLFSFCFSVTFGAMWEIYEFTYDQITGGNMQRVEVGRGVDDTMHDIILESGSALVLNIFIYIYLRSGADNLIGRVWESFLKLNPPRRVIRDEILRRKKKQADERSAW
ncbi:hypothetical protein NT6N_06860 [Oceaniferula spumae]|uniref:DUF2238 domain-containing protein n=1 Tax=Oceaniferula spumae TaxID=2979115 RepID=A0AAT9FHY1_9BACT